MRFHSRQSKTVRAAAWSQCGCWSLSTGGVTLHCAAPGVEEHDLATTAGLQVGDGSPHAPLVKHAHAARLSDSQQILQQTGRRGCSGLMIECAGFKSCELRGCSFIELALMCRPPVVIKQQ